jgi:hypothetical protein
MNPKRRGYTLMGKSKVYHWCPHHLQWTIHSPSECKRQPSMMRKKNIFKKTKKKKRTSRQRSQHTFRPRQHIEHVCLTQMRMKRIVTLIMMRTLTGHSLITHQKAAMIPDKKGVRSGSHCYLMQPTNLFWYIGNKFGFGYSTGYCHCCYYITYQ